MSADQSISTRPDFTALRQLGETTLSILITSLVFSLVVTGLSYLWVVAADSGTAAAESPSGAWQAVAVFDVPTIAIGVILTVLFGFPVNFVIGRATHALPSAVRIALNYEAGWLIASLIFGLLSLGIASSNGGSPSGAWNVFVIVTVLGIIPGLVAAAGTAVAHAVASRVSTRGGSRMANGT